MSKLKYMRRLLVIAIGLYAGAVVLYGLVVLVDPSISKSEVTPSSADFNAGLSQALVNWQQQKIKSPVDEKTLDDAQLRLLEATVEQFRQSAIVAAKTTSIAQLPQVTPGALEDFVNAEISKQFPYIWSYLLSGSFPVFGQSLGDNPIVAYYNPYFDLALMTQWQISDTNETGTTAGFKLTQAWPVTGRAFIENRASLASDTPSGSEPGTLFEVRIVNAAQAFVVSFEDRYPPFEKLSLPQSIDIESKRQAIAIAEDRIFYLIQWVSDARDPSAPVNYASAIDSLREALSATSPDELKTLLPADNPQTAADLFTLPADVRAGMMPYLVVDKNVIFIDPIHLPTAFLSTYFEPVGQSYKLALAALFNLHSSYSVTEETEQ